MRNAGIVWTRDTLAAYLVDPTGHIPGSRMFATGLHDPAEIEALLDYLELATDPNR
jgi:cytochrome c